MSTLDSETLEKKLGALKLKQNLIDKSWRQTGNRPLLQFFVEIIPASIKADRCSIFVHDPADEKVWLQCGTGMQERQISVPKRSSMVGEVICTGKSIMRTDMNDIVGAHATVDMQTGYITYDALCVPIHGATTDKITGAIQVLNKKGGGQFTGEDQALLERLAQLLQANIESLFLRQEMFKISLEMGKKIRQLEQALRQD